MICAVCYCVLRGHQGAQWRGTYDLHFDHHVDRVALEKSASMRCCICRSILSELSRIEHRDPETENRFTSASLSEIWDDLYRLDFKLRDSENIGTFVLPKTEDYSILPGYNHNSEFFTPFSHSTSSDEVLELAKEWIMKCRGPDHPDCPGEESEDELWHPSRLIDLGPMNDYGEREEPDKVHLVEMNDLHNVKDYYVTLSHCWGKAQFLRLTEENRDELKAGFDVKSLPKTFQDAIEFARRLGSVRAGPYPDSPPLIVRYIWIDSLCIIQGDSDLQREDWLRESAQMYQIYNNSYCNLSATASTDSNQGLFYEREPHELWEDEINLNIEGIPLESGPKPAIQRCSILDLSFWARNIDDAPVNRRGWVLQERLMAPRVLHFCENQIAWECRDLEAAESARLGVPELRLRGGTIVSGGSLKSLVPHLRRPVSNTMAVDPAHQAAQTNIPGQIATQAGETLPAAPPPPSIEPYQRWKLVVETYSKTHLTNPGDKLIALSGIAKIMSSQLEDKYLAGLWKCHLASQLLWRVDPVFENGAFRYLSQRAATYRAPTWSWAAVDAARGVVYGEILEDGDAQLLIAVEKPEVTKQADDEFGLVSAGHLFLIGVLKKIDMRKVHENGSDRYRWNLVTKIGGAGKHTHSNVCLDSPDTDADILGFDGRLYCMPARKNAQGYLICLLLQLEWRTGETGNYRRVGVAKIPPYERPGQEKVLELSGDEAGIPHGNWDGNEDKHTICVI